METRTEILLVAINARYSHCGMAGRSLLANLEEMRDKARLLEFDLDILPLQLVDQILEHRPRIVAFSVYLWNRHLVTATAQLLRRLTPQTAILLGGPEIVSDGHAQWDGLAHALVCGEGETVLRNWCRRYLRQPVVSAPVSPEVIVAEPVRLDSLALPYDLYDRTDLEHRTIYVETARGCPFQCHYCCSRNSGWRPLPLKRLFRAFDRLLARGARHLKVLDRSFNVNLQHACEVLDYFLDKALSGLRLHLEWTPTELPSDLLRRLRAFPPGGLHLEVGIQTLNPDVARAIGRPESRSTVIETLQTLQEIPLDLHGDLIFGLPGEDEESFAAGFDRLAFLELPELQVNRLKGLPGTPLRPTPHPGDRFSPWPPYDLLYSDKLSFQDLARMQRFAMTWDRLNNRGHFRHTLPLLWRNSSCSPYTGIGAIAEDMYRTEGRLHAIGTHTWAKCLWRHLKPRSVDIAAQTRAALQRDGIPDPVLDSP